MTSRMQVWLRPLGRVCRVRVDSRDHADWLLKRLSHFRVFRTSAPIAAMLGIDHCTFELSYESRGAMRQIEQLMAGMPEVQLMTGPE